MRELARTSSVRACVWNESPGASEAEIVIELGSSEAGVRHDCERLADAFALAAAASDRVDHLRDARARAANPDPIGIRARVLATHLDTMRRALLDANFAVSIDLGLGVLNARGGGE